MGLVFSVALVAPALALDTLPAGIDVPSTQVVLAKYFGVGTQNYACNATSLAFVLASANADLYKDDAYKGDPVAKHFFLPVADANGGKPTFQHLATDSSVTVKVLTKVNDADPVHNIQALLLTRTSGSTTGKFAGVNYVVRLDTHEGVAPTTACKADDTIKVPYHAQYWFFVDAPAQVTSSVYDQTQSTEAAPAQATYVPAVQPTYVPTYAPTVAPEATTAYAAGEYTTTAAPSYTDKPIYSGAKEAGVSLLGLALAMLF
ncbi:hypothetical protein HDV03_003985 [Kappamyces sp. JEL0829]|nr:hypothetical protein HDV03_003985 [Kappamyces sp. JEL0829]